MSLQNQQLYITDLFAQADLLLFKDKKYHEAETIYRKILTLEKSASEL